MEQSDLNKLREYTVAHQRSIAGDAVVLRFWRSKYRHSYDALPTTRCSTYGALLGYVRAKPHDFKNGAAAALWVRQIALPQCECERGFA